MSKPKESLIDLNIKSDLQHPVYLKQITVAQWNPKTSCEGSRVKGRVEPCTQKPILNQECFTTITSTWEAINIKYAVVSSHIKANLTAVEFEMLP